MTQSEFEGIVDFYDLRQFCYDNCCNIMDDVFDSDDINSIVEEDIIEMLHHQYWYTIRDKLNEIPRHASYLRRNGFLDYEEIGDDEFVSYFHRILEWALYNDVFDPDEGEAAPESVDGSDAASVPAEPEFEVDGAMFDALFPLSV